MESGPLTSGAWRGKRAAVFYPVPIYYDGQGYSSDSVTFRSITSWGSCFEKLDLVTCLKPATGGKGKLAIEAGNLTIIGLPYAENTAQMHLGKAPETLWSIFRLICSQRKNWDLVILFDSIFPNWFAYGVCRLLRVPVALRMVGRYDLFVWESLKYESPAKRALGFLYGTFIRYLQSSAAKGRRVVTDGDRSFAPSPFRERIGFCVETYLGADGIPKRNPYPGRERQELLRVLSISRVHPAKGLHVLLDAVSLLRRKGIPVQVDIVGPTYGQKYGSYEEKIRQRLEEGGLTNVTVHGWLPEGDEVERLWSAADLFVVPYTSHADGVPRVIFEAMRYGVPLVASRVGGIGSVLADGDTALLVPPGDPQALAGALEKLRDEGARRALSERGFAKAREYTTEAVSERLAEQLALAAQGAG